MIDSMHAIIETHSKGAHGLAASQGNACRHAHTCCTMHAFSDRHDLADGAAQRLRCLLGCHDRYPKEAGALYPGRSNDMCCGINGHPGVLSLLTARQKLLPRQGCAPAEPGQRGVGGTHMRLAVSITVGYPAIMGLNLSWMSQTNRAEVPVCSRAATRLASAILVS